ncbi:MAG TPA: hypothetical protein VM261_03555 [Kofleriaceae bacterium]|nr:hypothetical protein [Kofleriaceae bacterium]
MRIDPIAFFGALEAWKGGRLERAAHLLAEQPRWRKREREQFHYDLLVWSLALDEYGFAEALLDAGVVASARNRGTFSPLHFAADRRDRRGLRLLLSKGADASTGLLHAVQSWDPGLIDFFLEAGADVRIVTDESISLFRTHGAILRRLATAGARFPADIEAMLKNNEALGDSGKPPLPTLRPWRGEST